MKNEKRLYMALIAVPFLTPLAPATFALVIIGLLGWVLWQ